MGLGLYELIADTELVEPLIGGRRKEWRPQAAGDSPIWPFLETVAGMGWWPLRSRVLPMVAVRPWFGEQEVRKLGVFELTARQPEIRSPLLASRRTTIRRTTLKAYVKADDRMRHRCPNCHRIVDATTFERYPTFDCIEVNAKDEKSEGMKIVYEHKYVENSQGVIIPKAYLDVARARPKIIHTVAVAGYTRAGKTTFLLSLGGLLDYPDSNPVFSRCFPSSLHFRKNSLAIYDFERGGGLIDRKAATEAMWFDGLLPIRNEKYGKALRDQVLFHSKPGPWEREVVLILDDMAGEAISDPKMVTNENFPHFASIADVIYIVPAEDMSASIMEEFVNRLAQANAEGVPIDLSRVNLIFVISKIDQLADGSPAERDLFARILPHPDQYRLPQHGQGAELKTYFDEMVQVHYGIEDWLRIHKPKFFDFFGVFGSLRCCGLSAFGFEPTKEPVESKREYTLAFRPKPVRVVDPLFWLLKENGLIHF